MINKINELTAEKNRNSGSLSEISNSVKKNNAFEQCVRDSNSKLETAADGFLAIGESSSGRPQNLNTVFEESNRLSKNGISSAFEKLRKTQTILDNKLQELNSQISQFQSELENEKRRESSLQILVSEKQRVINNATMEMAYHKKHMY